MWRVIVLLCCLGGPALADLTGRISVTDGDTFHVGGTVVRLHGIDAPETAQRCGGQGVPTWECGAWVTRAVRSRYEGRTARCTVLDTDRYGRSVARCAVDGADVGRALVRDGLAFAYRRYSMDYDLDEKGAAVSKRGLHGMAVTSPAAFRALGRKLRESRRAPAAAAAPAGCVIKGNIASDGDRIYHVPGQDWYMRTKISPNKGERWFCSEAEARAAGWRPARR